MTTPPTHKQLGALERRRNARGAALARMVQPPQPYPYPYPYP